MRLALSILSLLAAASFARAEDPAEKLPPGAKVVGLSVTPKTVAITGPYSYAQLVLTATLDGGDIADVTRMATWNAPTVVTVSHAGQVRPKDDGSAAITATIAGQTLSVPVTVTGMHATKSVSFVKDVQPVLSKLGCNGGTCHGSAQGKNGFKLSLRGYDPVFDHRALTDDVEGRRFNRAAPDRSLMLLKPTGAVPHAGGVTMHPGDPYYEMLRQWIAEGVKQDLTAQKPASIELFPKNLTIPLPEMRQQFAVVATFPDGSKRDVSAEAFLESSNIETIGIEKTGLVTALRRGEATVLARYDGAYAASTAVIMGDRAGFAWQQRPVYNKIDELVDAKLKKVKIVPSEFCDDAEFLRRVSIDLTGLPPTADAATAFIADARPSREKRDELVDKLVGSEAFVEQWTNRWADLLQVNRKFLGEKGATALRAWIKNAVATNMPYDKFAYEILTASGSTAENPPAAYYKVLREPTAAMENTTQLFLAVRFNCNKCHDHPFEKWTQDQYFALASFFAQVKRTEDAKFKGQKIGGSAVEGAVPLVEEIADAAVGELKHDRTGKNAVPSFPFVHGDMPAGGKPRRTQLGQWLTSKENPYFARSYANRLWSYLTGVGVIEPVDDIRAGNPPTNPALLDWLTDEFVKSGFDSRNLIKTICKSRTYQLSIATNKFNRDDDLNYSHAVPRRLPAEVLFDSIHRATGSQSHLPGLPAGARAAQLVDSNVELPGGFLELFGKPARESACECERSNTMMLGPVLAMVNGPIVADAVADPAGTLSQFTAATPDDAKVVSRIYLSVLNRPPTADEVATGVNAIRSAKPDFDRLTADFARRKKALADYEATIPAKQAAWEAGILAQKPTAWTVLDLKELKARSGATFTKQADGSTLVGGKKDGTDLYTLRADVKLPGVTAVRLEAIHDASLPAKGPGRADNGNLVLNEFKATVKPLAKPSAKAKPVKFNGSEATFAQATFPVANAIDGNPATGWALSGKLGEDSTALFKVAAPPKGAGDEWTFTLNQQFGTNHTLGRFRLSVTADANPSLSSSVPKALVALLESPSDKRTPEAKAKVTAAYAAQDKELARLRAEASTAPPADSRVLGAQDLVWALINSPAFLFNH